MEALKRRREEDAARIRNMASLYPGRVQLLECDRALSTLKIRLRIPTARDESYPAAVQEASDIEITLPRRYPFEEPYAKVLTPVWNPNIFQSGKICLGTKWLPTEGLDLLVERIMKLLAFDPLIINTKSPANSTACTWYIGALKQKPSAFPSVVVDELKQRAKKTGMIWKNIETKGSWNDV
ncbi:MAG: ubiquitin-conjugating enzyme E2 [Candidatus Eremiobacteraeota bacterium]|nr:ubiquitin-conjugating enzyme E2 [Candidatus Eremiobacteraeota bacterium]